MDQNLRHRRSTADGIRPGAVQVEGAKLRDYEGNYSEFLEKNEDEAQIMAAKEAKQREIEKSSIKAKSKMSKVHHPSAPCAVRCCTTEPK